MSSLAATGGDGYYHPPDWDPKRTSRNKFQGSKGASVFARRGIVRFERPRAGRCEGCRRRIGRGTRLNAKKTKAGAYFTTTIWSFEMRCPRCKHIWTIRTDPRARDYVYAEGLRRTAGDEEEEEEERRGRSNVDDDDAFKAVETRRNETQRRRRPIIMTTTTTTKDERDDANARARKKARTRRKTLRRAEEEGRRRGLDVPLLPESDADRIAARETIFRTKRVRTSVSLRESLREEGRRRRAKRRRSRK